MDVLRLVLVDDYRMVTEALASRLSSAPDLWVAGCCQTDDPRLPEVVRWLRPDIVLIDVEPLGIAIAEVLGRIKAAWPAVRVIVVSADGDAAHAVEAARAGADAWVSKSQGADQLETVLRGVARGQAWFPPEMLGEVIRGLRDDVQAARESSNLLDTLSPRELDVLTSMAKGKRARQIAAELMISADTVRTHTRSIFGKLEVHSRIEAVSVAWAAGLRPEDAHAEQPEGAADLAARRPSAAQARPPAAAPAVTRRDQVGQAGEPGKAGKPARPGRPGPGHPDPGGRPDRDDRPGRAERPAADRERRGRDDRPAGGADGLRHGAQRGDGLHHGAQRGDGGHKPGPPPGDSAASYRPSAQPRVPISGIPGSACVGPARAGGSGRA
jgi:two-component system, NarL family, response regulator LiaR